MQTVLKHGLTCVYIVTGDVSVNHVETTERTTAVHRKGAEHDHSYPGHCAGEHWPLLLRAFCHDMPATLVCRESARVEEMYREIHSVHVLCAIACTRFHTG